MIAGLSVAVVVPAFDEEARVGRTVARVPGLVDHVVVVDDASRDGTARAAGASGDPRVTVVRHAQNRGVGAAIATGYREARRRGADLVAVMAGDDQMDPDDLPALLAPLVSGRADYVKGNRLGHPRAREMPAHRRLGTWALGRATSWAIGAPLGDSQCGYTAITGALIDALPLERLFPRYGYPNDLLSMIARSGGRIAEAPVRPVYAGERSGLRPWHVAVMLGLIGRARARRAWG
ncbi:MAG: glycosyltransferase family 2 protein [Polyangiaceae bacterium]|nr:glycosyltransferase family 2 protein [Polyangiaceae bacterium]